MGDGGEGEGVGVYGGDGDGAGVFGGVFSLGFGDECEGCGCAWGGGVDACGECGGGVDVGICMVFFCCGILSVGYLC